MNVRNILGLTAVAAIFGFVGYAQALPDVCTMANTEVKGVRASAEEIASYKAKLAVECELSEKYQQMQNKAHTKYGISLEQITLYQAIRYVRRGDYSSSKYTNTPPNLTYQIFDAQYKNPETKDSKIWDGFVKGIETLSTDRERVRAGGSLQFGDLMRIHRNFYQVSDERGDHANPPSPGVIKSASPNDGAWWHLKPEEVSKTSKIVDEINGNYGELGLLQSGLEALYETPELNFRSQVISVKPLKDGSGYGVYGGDSRGNEEHIQTILKFVNSMLSQARQNGAMVQKGRLLTPGELAFLVQQFIVQVHPFQDGNGRTTRYLQELILTSFGMPHGSSGDLMDDDVLTQNPAYYSKAIESTKSLLASVDNCLEKTYPQAMSVSSTYMGSKSDGHKNETRTKVDTISFSELNQATVDYDCRLVK